MPASQQDQHPSIPPLIRRLLPLLCLLLLAVLCLWPGITTIPPMDRDEARFVQSSRQMLETGDFVTPRFQEELRAKKPVGIYWLQAASAALLGQDNIAGYRLPSLFGAVLVIAVGFGLACQLLGFSQGVVAGLLMLAALVLAAEARLAKTDSMLAAVIILQQSLIWQIARRGLAGIHISGWLSMAFWVVLSAGILIKGPVSPALGLLTVLTMAGLRRQWGWLAGFRPLLGVVIVSAMVLPWVVLVTSATDGAFLGTAIKGDFVAKLQSGQESHGAPPLTHLLLLPLTLWPWGLLLGRAIPLWWQRRDWDMTLFIFAWIMPFWLLLELTPTKLPHYILPLMPALAILAAPAVVAGKPKLKEMPAAPRTASWWSRIDVFGWVPWLGGKPGSSNLPNHRITGRSFISRGGIGRLAIMLWEGVCLLAAPLLGVFVVYAATLLGGDRRLAFIALGLSLLVLSGGIIWLRRGKQLWFFFMLGAGVLFQMVTLGGVLPSLERMHIGPRLEKSVAAITPAVEAVVLAGYHEPSAVFALGRETLLFSAGEAALFLAEAPAGLAIVEARSEGEFLAASSRLGLNLVLQDRLQGYNISRGRQVALSFWQLAPPKSIDSE